MTLFLAACQTDDLVPKDAAKDGSAAGAVQASTGLYNQTLGAGAVRIGYIGVRRLDQPSRQADSETRDGAALAVNSLGSDVIKLNMVETTEKPEQIEAAAKTLALNGASLIITTARGPELEIIQKGLAGRPVPLVAFQTNEATLPPSVYAFMSNPVDSLIEAASFAMAEGGRHAVILASSPAEKLQAERVAAQIKAFGGKVEPVIEVVGGVVPAKLLASWGKADMVVLMPGVKSPGDVLKKTDAAKPPTPGRRLVASSVLTPADLAEPKLTGTIVCRYDQNIQARIGKRYMDSYGMPASANAGYGFDATAMAIGLVSRWGDSAFTPERMMASEGFSGALGVFRLEEGGKVRRNCDIFKVSKGSYVFFQRAPATL
ncbi:MAG: hypothetical protein QE284_09250 [Rhizobium sp.]|nr:hypothetical protein [Rhizobium sp.]